MPTQLGLGTAQFGLDYGITNKTGRVDVESAREILEVASRGGIKIIDTAQAYGMAEKLLGEALPAGNKARIVTKFAPSPTPGRAIDLRDRAYWDKCFKKSCEDLQREEIDTLLLHDPNALKRDGHNILEDWMISLKERGLVKKLGISAYEIGEIRENQMEWSDVLQLPSSVLDQRLITSDNMARIRECGIEIHARSAFLQGLLLTPESGWPTWTPAEARANHSKLSRLAEEKGCRLLDLALGYFKDQDRIDVVIVGVSKLSEIIAILDSWNKKSPWNQDEWRYWASNDRTLIDPRNWPR